MKKSKSEPKTKLIEELTKKFLENLEITAKVKVSEDEAKMVNVQIETDDPGILIGYHGETLASFQLILTLMFYRKANEWARILVNVGDYREKRQEALEHLALSAAQRVKFSGKEYSLPPMTPAERRIIHLILAGDSEVTSESEGEDYQRRVVIKPKK